MAARGFRPLWKSANQFFEANSQKSYARMTMMLRILSVLLLSWGVLACGSEVETFEMDVQLTGGCMLNFDRDLYQFAILAYQDDPNSDTEQVSCYASTCSLKAMERNPRGCLSGVESPDLTPGTAVRLKVMFLTDQGNVTVCGEAQTTNLASDWNPTIILHCKETCSSPVCDTNMCRSVFVEKCVLRP